MKRYLLDTSIFIAIEHERAIGDPPEGSARVSVATLTELAVGVHRSDSVHRARRETSLAMARRFIALPYDESVARHLAVLIAAARDARRRFGFLDAVIAATALAHDLTVWTQDRDFELLAELEPALRFEHAEPAERA